MIGKRQVKYALLIRDHTNTAPSRYRKGIRTTLMAPKGVQSPFYLFRFSPHTLFAFFCDRKAIAQVYSIWREDYDMLSCGV